MCHRAALLSGGSKIKSIFLPLLTSVSQPHSDTTGLPLPFSKPATLHSLYCLQLYTTVKRKFLLLRTWVDLSYWIVQVNLLTSKSQFYSHTKLLNFLSTYKLLLYQYFSVRETTDGRQSSRGRVHMMVWARQQRALAES